MSAVDTPVGDTRPVVRLDDVFGSLKLSPYGLMVLILCFLVAMTEGYDVQAMALAAPVMRAEWSLQPGQLGVLLSASVVGLVLGSFLLAPLGDRWGRKPAIIAGLVVAGLGTGAGAWAPDVPTLLVTRVVAGVGLGLALPVTIALAMETLPLRGRTVVVAVVMSGYPLGGSLGGWAAGEMIETQGYGAIFLMGGIGAGVAAALCALLLPESPYFLAGRERSRPALRRLLARLRAPTPPADAVFISRETHQARSTVAALFTPERRVATLLLWLINFANLAMVYFFISWLPSLFIQRGLSADMAIKGAALFSGGGVVGGLLLAVSMRRLGPTLVLGGSYVVSILAILGLALLPGVGALFVLSIFVAGAAVVGSQFCLTAVVNQFYPSAIRVTGGGYATGAGRVGAMVAPLAGGAVLSVLHDPQHAFLVTTAPALAALAAIAFLWRRRTLAGTVSAGA